MTSVRCVLMALLVLATTSFGRVLVNPVAETNGTADQRKQALAADLVTLYLNAIGGKSAIAALKNTYSQGYNEFDDKKVPIRIWGQAPDHLRIEMQLDPDTLLIQGYDGLVPWQYRIKGHVGRRESLSTGEAEAFVSQADFHGPVYRFRQKGNKLEYIGEGKIDDQSVYRIRVEEPSGLKSVLSFDESSYQLVEMDTTQVIRGRDVPTEMHFSNFQPVAGVWLPFKIETTLDNQLTLTTVYTKIEPNVPIPDGTFSPPGEK